MLANDIFQISKPDFFMFHGICVMWIKISRLTQAFFHAGCQCISRVSTMKWQTHRHTTDRISNKTSKNRWQTWL